MMISDTMKLILSLSVSGSILAVVLFILKPFIKNRMSKSFQYYIWLIVLVRLVLPFSFEINLMNVLFNETPTVVSRTQLNNQMGTIESVDYNTLHQQSTTNQNRNGIFITNIDILLFIWGFGLCILLSYNIISYFQFTMMLSKSNINALNGDKKILKSLSDNKSVALYRNPLVKTPLLLGVFKPRIILPNKEYTESQLNNILIHELTHLNRCDIVIKWFVILITAFHWFNPIVHFIKHQMNKACELSCDERLIKLMDTESKQLYGDTLISVAEKSPFLTGITSTTMCEDMKTLKERLLAIMNYKSKSKLIIFVSAMLFILFCSSSVILGVYNSERDPLDDLNKSTLNNNLQNTYNQDLLNELIKYKTTYIGDNSKVGNIVSRLPALDSNMKYERFALQTTKEPYGLIIYYTLIDSIDNYLSDEYNNSNSNYHKNRDKNIALLFSLIGNLDYITFITDFTLIDNGHQNLTIMLSSYDKLYGTPDELWIDNGSKLLKVFNDIDSHVFENIQQEDEVNALNENGSPLPEFETDEDRNYLISTIKIRDWFNVKLKMSDKLNDKIKNLY